MSVQSQIDRLAGAKTTLGNYLQQNGVAVQSGATLDEMALQLADVIEKQNKITAAGILKGDGAGGVSAATAGTDYATPAQVAAKQDVLLASGASVGDLIKVKAVDASGKPTAWAVAVAGTDYAAPSLGLTGTAVGQVPAVKTIDEQGKPTKWEAIALPNEAFIVYFTLQYQMEGDPVLTSDRTPEEVIAAITAKKPIIALLAIGKDITQLGRIDNRVDHLYFYGIRENGIVDGVGWNITEDTSGEKTYTLTTISSGNFIKYTGVAAPYQILFSGEAGTYELKQHIGFENLPEVTTSDNGKFMRVVNGAWAIAAIDNANGGSF